METPRKEHAWHEKFFGARFTTIPPLKLEGKLFGPFDVALIPIGPTQAQQVLDEHNNKNRLCGPSHPKRLAAAMRLGQWCLTGEPIIFDNKHELRNGQNRLDAVVQSGTTQPFLVIVGIDPDAFNYMDQGTKRTLAQVLQIRGVSRPREVASTIPLLQAYFRSGSFDAFQSAAEDGIIGVQESFLAAYPSISEAVEFILDQGRGWRLFTSKSLPTALYWLFAKADAGLAPGFMGGLLTYSIPEEERFKTCRALHHTLTENLQSKQYKKTNIAMIAVRAWNAVARNKAVSRHLLTRDLQETFPMIEGLEYDDDFRPVIHPEEGGE